MTVFPSAYLFFPSNPPLYIPFPTSSSPSHPLFHPIPNPSQLPNSCSLRHLHLLTRLPLRASNRHSSQLPTSPRPHKHTHTQPSHVMRSTDRASALPSFPFHPSNPRRPANLCAAASLCRSPGLPRISQAGRCEGARVCAVKGIGRGAKSD